MYLYLRDGDSLELLLSGVALEDWYHLVIEDVENDLQLEPAIWFKSLIIDGILIDCNCRQVRWSRVGMEPGDPSRKASVFEDYNYSELDPKAQELFEATRQVLISLRNKEISTEQYKIELFRLLHCYIMPSILLKTDDISNLHKALARVQEQIQSIGEIILEKDMAVQSTESSLAIQRKEILEKEDFTSESHILSCSSKFLQVFEKHIGKDVEEALKEFEIIQGKVNELKLRNSPAEELGLVRKERDDRLDKWEKTKLIQETIKQATKSKRSSKVDTTNYNFYIELNERLLEEKKEKQELCSHKIQISAVREAIKQALDDLKTDGQTVGWQIKSDGTTEHDTDVIGIIYKPRDWYTLDESISFILADVTNDVTQRHIRFCSGVLNKIAAALKESELFQDQTTSNEDKYLDIDIHEDLQASGQRSRDRIGRSIVDIPEDKEHVSRRQETVFLSLLDVIKREVNDHLLNTVKLLSLVITENSCHGAAKSNISGKIAIYYHNILSHKIMGPLESLYDKTYGRICVNVFNKTKDMSFEELGIDEPWICCLNDAQVTEVKRPVETESVESVHSITSDLSHQSIDKQPVVELYHQVKRECEELDDCPEFDMCMHPSPANDTELAHSNGMIDDSPPQTSGDYQTPLSAASLSNEESNSLPPSCGEHCTGVKTPEVKEGESLYDILQPGLEMVHTLVKEITITGKLKMITKTYRFVGNKASALKSATSLQDFKGCRDELLTLLIVLLTYLDERDFKRLFIQMYLVKDFKPECILGGVHDCSLTYFFTAFQYLQDRLPSRHTTLYQT